MLNQHLGRNGSWINPTTQCRPSFRLRGERKVSIDGGPKSNWSCPSAIYKGSSRFLQLGANNGPDVCGLSGDRSTLHHAPEFGKHGQNYKSPRGMGGNIGDRSSEEESPCPVLRPKQKIFLSHSGKQKEFVKDLCEDLEARFRFPFLDIHPSSLPKGEPFPKYLFQAARQCKMAVVVVSDDYFTSPWPMIELTTFVQARLRANPDLKILPVFFGLSISEFRDPLRRQRWFNVWRGWAEADERINPLDFERALKEMGLFNGFEFCQNVKELRTFRRQIVSSICNDISPDIKWDDSHVQGRSTMCEVVREKIQDGQALRMKNISSFEDQPKNFKAHVIGFYGMGGIGKTTMCKVLCNELSEFDGRICHVELAANQSSEGLLKEVLKNFTDINEPLLQKLEEGKCKYILSDEMSFQQKTFLAIDNVWDDSKSIEQAKMFLEAPFCEGSIVLVTARSQDTLKCLGIDEYFEVPQLEKGDARKLFLYHAAMKKQLVSYDDNHIIEACLNCCYFQKSEKQGFHYLPLALKILGLHLGCISKTPADWMKSLSKVRDFNYFSEEKNPLFSVIRLNYDRLPVQEQSLFMDVALYWPRRHYLDDDTVRENYQDTISLIEWLSLVHNQKVDDTQNQLLRLKAKGLLEDVNFRSQEVSMHDLYYQFAELETQGKLKFVREAQLFTHRKWVYENSYPSDLEVTPSGRCWENLIRVGVALPFWSMFDISSLDRVQWTYCANVVVLMLFGLAGLKGVLNLKGLTSLRSLELGDLHGLDGLEGLEELSSLTYLRWLGRALGGKPSVGRHLGQLPASLQILEVTGSGVHVRRDVFARCTNLRHLKLDHIGAVEGDVDFSRCTSLRHVELRSIEGLKRLNLGGGLLSLQSLDISDCHDLSEVGLGHLVGLLHLCLFCGLQKLPDLQYLTSLQVLRIGMAKTCDLPGLGSLVQLRELKLQVLDIFRLPNLSRLVHLQTLEVSDCWMLVTLDGVIDELPALRRLCLYGCASLARFPNLSRSTKLEELILGVMVLPEEKDIYVLAELPSLRLIKIVDYKTFNDLLQTLADDRFDHVRQKLLSRLTFDVGFDHVRQELLSRLDLNDERFDHVGQILLGRYTFERRFMQFRIALPVASRLNKRLDISTEAWQAVADLFRASGVTDARDLVLKPRLIKAQPDEVIEFIVSWYSVCRRVPSHLPFPREELERWVREHIPDTSIRLFPHMGKERIHSPLSLVFGLRVLEPLTRREYFLLCVTKIRHVLNIVQAHAIAKQLSLITFDADSTIYADGHHIESDNEMIGYIIELMCEGIQVAIFTAAGYRRNASKFESRLAGLLEAFKERKLPPHIQRRFHVMDGECNYLLSVNSDFQLEFVPDELWKSSVMFAWIQPDVAALPNNAERSLNSGAARVRVLMDIVRKPRAVGAVPTVSTIYEELEDMAFSVDCQLMERNVPFLAFNGNDVSVDVSNDVFVDVGIKFGGLRALMMYLNTLAVGTLHVGDRFSVRWDLYAALWQPVLWVANPEETAYFARRLLRDIRLGKLNKYIE